MLNYEEGYDWETESFGPPPGISKRKKLRLGTIRKILLCFIYITINFVLFKTIVMMSIVQNSFSLLDEMNGRDYMHKFLRMNEARQQCLMISEAERRRTFVVLWS